MSDLKMDDTKIERMVAALLRAGVILSGSVVAAGGVYFLIRHGGEPTNYKVFKREPAELRLVPDIIAGAFSGHASALIQLGVLLLIATPIARVVLSLVGFALERDGKYVLITAIVLSVLLFSLVSGAAGF